MIDQAAVENGQVAPEAEESDADLEAGFNAVRGGEQPAPQTQEPDPGEPASGSDAAPSAETEQPPETEAPTKDPNAELREQLAQLQSSVRNIAGNFGGLKSELHRLKELQSVQQTQPQGSPAAEAAKHASAVVLKRVKEEYPELAELFTADLNEILGAVGNARPQSVDLSEVDRRVESRMARLEQQTAKEVLNSVHPDWEVEVAAKDGSGNPIRVQAKDAEGRPLVDAAGRPQLVLQPSKEFTSWLQSKGPEFSQTFWNTNSAAFLVRAMSEFKTKHSGSTQQQSKQDRLRSAALPQGRGGSAKQVEIDEEAAMSLGFASVRGQT